MKPAFARLLSIIALCLLCPLSETEAMAQASESVGVDISLTSPPPSCGFTLESDLVYGTAEKPTTGSGSVTISATTGARSSSGTTTTGSSSVGQVRLSGSNVSTYSVTRTFPGTLTRLGGGSLPYSGAWAQSASQASGYTTVAGAIYTGAAGGAGSSFTRYFRYGGTASGIDISDQDGSYTGIISVSATCN